SSAPFAPKLSIADAMTDSGQYLHSISSAKIKIDDIAASIRWCITETNQAPASSVAPCIDGKGPSSGWFITSPQGAQVSVSSGNGQKTLYLWAADASGNLSSVSSASITLDSTIPSAPSVQLKDP